MVKIGRLLGAQLRATGEPNICLTAAALPGGPWAVTDARTWRTGASGSRSEAASRARDISSVTSLRSFSDPDRGLDVVLMVIPFASPEDARAGSAELRAMPAAPNRRSRATPAGDRSDVLAPEIAGAPECVASEQATTISGRGGDVPGRVLQLWAPADRHLIVLTVAGLAAAATWSMAADIAERQIAQLPA